MVTSVDLKLFTCNGCDNPINPEHARILCNVCDKFNLCSNCYVLENSSKSHRKSHATTLFRNSGYMDSENENQHTLVLPLLEGSSKNLRSPSVEIQRKYSEIPTANWGALWSVMKAPLTKKDKRATKSVERIETGYLKEAGNKHDLLSPLSGIPEPRFSSNRVIEVEGSPGFPAPTYFRPSKWESFFDLSNTPTSIFVGLMSSIFHILDEKGTGYLRPEIYSAFLDMQGYPLSANIWKMAWTKAAGASSKDVADLELGLYFSKRSVSYTLAARPSKSESSNCNSHGKTTSQDLKRLSSTNVNQNMPLLSRQGFIDICASEYLQDTSMAYQYLMNALHELKVWKELGDLPRSVLPSSPTTQPSLEQGEELGEKDNESEKAGENQRESKKMKEESEAKRKEGKDDILVCSPKTKEKKQVKPTSKLLKENNHSSFQLKNEHNKEWKSHLSPPKVSSCEPISLRFTVNGCEDRNELLSSFPIKKPHLVKSPNRNLHEDRQRLVVNTNLPNQWLMTATAMSAKSPQRKKVEMLVEAYEYVRANSICLDERPKFKEIIFNDKTTA